MHKSSHHRKYRQPLNKKIIFFIAQFILILVVSFLYNKLSLSFLILYAICSILAFILYRRDKLAAKNNTWRTKESTLLWLGLMGGWPGALIAQERYRHKTSKADFQFMFWVSIVINYLGLIWWVLRDIF